MLVVLLYSVLICRCLEGSFSISSGRTSLPRVLTPADEQRPSGHGHQNTTPIEKCAIKMYRCKRTCIAMIHYYVEPLKMCYINLPVDDCSLGLSDVS